MKHSIYLVIIFFTLLAPGCTKKVDMQLPTDTAMPVLNAMIAQDSILYVRFTRSVPAGFPDGASYSAIQNATVQLFANGTLVESLEPVTVNNVYYFRSKTKLSGLKEWKLEATTPEFKDPVSGSVKMPKATLIESATVKSIKVSDYRSVNTFKVTIRDDGSVNNYYRLRIIPYRNGAVQYGDYIYFTITNLKMDEGGIFDDFIGKDPTRDKIFDDGVFNGKEFTFNLKNDGYSNSDGFRIELSTISESAYLYYKSVTLQDIAKDDPLYEKVPVYNNIKNGLGIVGAFNINIRDTESE